MLLNKKSLTFLFTIGCTTGAQAHTFDMARPDSHAPISIMGDHTHHNGEWMMSYRYMTMDMDGMRKGKSRVSSADVFADNYTVTPTQMTMDMHMFGLMYAPSDKLTLMAMVNYLDIEMDHQIFPMAAPLIALNGGSQTFTTQTSGFGDTVVSALYKFHEGMDSRAHVGLGLSLPTGSIDEKDQVPGPGGRIDRQLPAPMQLGSGTYDVIPSITYSSQKETFSYGLQAKATLRTGENDNDYKLGNKFELNSWISWKASDSISVSAGLGYQNTGELKGNQKDVGTAPPFAPSRRTVTTAFGENYGGDRLDALFGINIKLTQGYRLALDARLPVEQDLNGIQLETDSNITLGLQKTF